MNKPRRLRLRSGEMMIIIIVALLVLIGLTGNFSRIVEWLLAPYTAFIAIVMLVEYLIIKGADRSRIYHRELQGLRSRRKEDLLLFRDMEAQLESVKAELEAIAGHAVTDSDERSKELNTKLERQARELESVLDSLSKRV